MRGLQLECAGWQDSEKGASAEELGKKAFKYILQKVNLGTWHEIMF